MPFPDAGAVSTSQSTRLRILFLPGQTGSMRLHDIAGRFNVSRPAIPHHLKVLKTFGLVETERAGQEIDYSVRMDGIVRTLRTLADSLEACCNEPAARARRPARHR